MNTTEDFGNLQNSSELFSKVQQDSEDFSNVQNASQRTSGIGRGKKYPGAEIPDHDYDRDDYIIMEEAYAEFEAQGERRSVRMIAEYCKTGELVCTYDSNDKRWHITRESVENKISKIKALNARKAASFSPQSTSEHFSEDPATSRRTTEDFPPKSESAHTSSEDIKKLEQELLDLKIMNRGKDYLIDQLREERGDFISRIENTNYRIGQLETKVLQLEAPRPTPGNDTFTPPSDRNASPLVSNASPIEPLSDNTNENYEHSTQESYADGQR